MRRSSLALLLSVGCAGGAPTPPRSGEWKVLDPSGTVEVAQRAEDGLTTRIISGPTFRIETSFEDDRLVEVREVTWPVGRPEATTVRTTRYTERGPFARKADSPGLRDLSAFVVSEDLDPQTGRVVRGLCNLNPDGFKKGASAK